MHLIFFYIFAMFSLNDKLKSTSKDTLSRMFVRGFFSIVPTKRSVPTFLFIT